MYSDSSIISIKENTPTFSGQNIGRDNAKKLVEILKTNQRLIHLNLRLNHIGPEGATAFAEALETNHTIKYVIRNCLKNMSKI